MLKILIHFKGAGCVWNMGMERWNGDLVTPSSSFSCLD